MYRVVLVNVPFAALERPSLSLTQLKALLDRQFAGRVATEILYLNQEFASYLGFESYQTVAESAGAGAAGAGEWFFRQLAFPDAADNSSAYFRRYFSAHDEQIEGLKFALLEKRRGLERYFKRVIDRHRIDRADLVGFTSMFAQNVATFGLARLLKERNPELTTVMGGANCETPMGQEIVQHVPQIDFVFSGASLVSFPRFVGCRLEGRAEDCHRIDGVFSRQNLSGRQPAPGPVGQELPIDVEIPLDYTDFFAALQANHPGRGLNPCVLFETSRGCWWGERAHCTFCGLNGTTMRYRAMSPARAIAQFEDLFARYGHLSSHFESVDNILARSYLTEVLPHLSPPPGSTLFYEVKADLKAGEMEVLAAANVKMVQPGIESLSTSTLKLMRKGTTAFLNLRFLLNCALHEIRPMWNILVGFPGEEDEGVFQKYLADIPRLVHLPPPGVATVAFERYSPYHFQAREYGLDLHPAEYFTFIYPFGEEVLNNLVYYFSDANVSAPYAVVTAKWLQPLREAVQRWQERWWGKSGEPRPQLHLLGEEAVYDTRSGPAVTHPLGPLGSAVLRSFDTPKKPAQVALQLAPLPASDVAQEIDRLERLGLLFREGEQLLNIVFPVPPALAVAAAA